MTPAWRDAVVEFLDRTRLAQPDELGAAMNAAVAPMGIAVTLYVVDQEQRTLRPVPERGRSLPEPVDIDGTLAGRAFTTVRPVSGTAAPERPARLWMPLVDGTERLGVLDVVAADARLVDDQAFRAQFSLFAQLVGHLLAVKLPYGDTLVRARRSRRMSDAAELVWRLLPPLTFACHRLVVSAVLEPCYEVGGDGFDYAVDGSHAYVAVFDSVGHDLHAGLGTAVTLAATRSTRRDGGDLSDLAHAADRALGEYLPEPRFTTAVLADIDLDGGVLRYVNAGHPPPLLLRRGRVLRRLDRGRRLPLGLPDARTEVAHENLEPGDRLLLFTDGVTDSRDRSGRVFGLRRLIRLLERHDAAGLPAPETLRRLSLAAQEHGAEPPVDDATLLLVEWSESAVRRVMP